MASSHEQTSALLDAIATAGNAWAQEKPGARAELLTLAHALTAKLETPSEVLQRIGWAEVCVFSRSRLEIRLPKIVEFHDLLVVDWNGRLARSLCGDAPGG